MGCGGVIITADIYWCERTQVPGNGPGEENESQLLKGWDFKSKDQPARACSLQRSSGCRAENALKKSKEEAEDNGVWNRPRTSRAGWSPGMEGRPEAKMRTTSGPPWIIAIAPQLDCSPPSVFSFQVTLNITPRFTFLKHHLSHWGVLDSLLTKCICSRAK